jgi:hypothetical protein
VYPVALREAGNDVFVSETAKNVIIPVWNSWRRNCHIVNVTNYVVAQVHFPFTKAVSVVVVLQLMSQCDPSSDRDQNVCPYVT